MRSHTGHLVRAVSRQAEALRPIPPEGMHHSYVVTTTYEQHPQGHPKPQTPQLVVHSLLTRAEQPDQCCVFAVQADDVSACGNVRCRGTVHRESPSAPHVSNLYPNSTLPPGGARVSGRASALLGVTLPAAARGSCTYHCSLFVGSQADETLSLPPSLAPSLARGSRSASVRPSGPSLWRPQEGKGSYCRAPPNHYLTSPTRAAAAAARETEGKTDMGHSGAALMGG